MASVLCGNCGLEGGYHDETEVVVCEQCGIPFCHGHLFEANAHMYDAHNARFLSTWCTVCGATRTFGAGSTYIHTCLLCKYGVCDKCGVYTSDGMRGGYCHHDGQECRNLSWQWKQWSK